MAECEPSPLVLHIHSLTFYPSGTPDNETSATYFTDGNFNSYLQRVFIWGGLIILVGAVILVCSCIGSCCLCGFCYGGNLKPLSLRIGLGVVTIGLVIISITLLCVEFWLEFAIDGNIVNHAPEVVQFTQNISDAGDIVQNVVLNIEKKRHITTTVYLCFLLIIMLLTLLLASVTPVIKTSKPLFVMLMAVCVVAFITLIMVVLTFVGIVLYSDICVGLYDINPDLCTTSESISVHAWSEILTSFCNSTVTYSFVLFILGMFIILLLVLTVLFGLAYAASLTGKKQPTMVVLSPSGILEAYEAPEHALLKRNSLQFSEDEVPLIGVVDNI